MSILNDEESIYGTLTNSTYIATDFRGIGLPTTSFNQFTNLLDIISVGQSLCAKVQGGYCILPKSCEEYSSLWSYSFKIQFAGQADYMLVPLASFAANQEYTDRNECVIYVEMLDESFANSRQIVIG